MFDSEVTHALSFLNPHFCAEHTAGDTFSIEETKKDGKARLDVTTPLPCIHVRDLDINTYGLLKLQKCSDHIILKYNEDNQSWDLHIFEFKRKISKKKWEEDIIPQFHGGLMNTFALCGILHIHVQSIRHIYVHCGYRQNTSRDSLAEQKLFLGESAKGADWLNAPVRLDYLPDRTMINIPVKLDEDTGDGTFSLPDSRDP